MPVIADGNIQAELMRCDINQVVAMAMQSAWRANYSVITLW